MMINILVMVLLWSLWAIIGLLASMPTMHSGNWILDSNFN
jgi:hypothetical protein